MESIDIEKKLEDFKIQIKKGKQKLDKRRYENNKLNFLFGKERVLTLMEGTQISGNENTGLKHLNEDFFYFKIGSEGSLFAASKAHFSAVKKGFFAKDILMKEMKDGIAEILDVDVSTFSVVLEHIRNGFRLSGIGLPDDLEERCKLLSFLQKCGGLEKLQKRIEILCFVQSLNKEDESEKRLKMIQEFQILKKQIDQLEEESEKEENEKKNLLENIKEEQEKQEKQEMKKEEKNVIVVNVGGGDFVFPSDFEKCEKLMEKLEGTRLFDLLSKRKNNLEEQKKILDRSKMIFRKIYDYLLNEREFIRSTTSLDEEKKFLEEVKYFLGSSSPSSDLLRFPLEEIGEENLKLKLEEDFIREIFIMDRENPLLEKKNNLLLLSIFDQKKDFKWTNGEVAIPEDIPLLFNIEKEYPNFLKKHREIFVPPLVSSFTQFEENFKSFSSGLLEGLNYDNLFVAGGAVLANVLDYGFKKSPREVSSQQKRRIGGFPFKGRNYEMRMRMKEQMKKEKEQKEKENKHTPFESFKRKERLVNFNESSLDAFENSRYLSLLKVPISPLLLKRLIALDADLASASGFKASPELKYHGTPIPTSMQFFRSLCFQQNDFLLSSPLVEDGKEIEFKFAVGTEALPDHFTKLPEDVYPIGLSTDFKYLLFTTLNTSFQQDFMVFLTNNKGTLISEEPMPISSFITMLRKNEKLPPNETAFSVRNKYYSKSDIDMFLYDISVEKAREKIKEVYNVIRRNLIKQKGTIQDCLIIRTAYSITFQFHQRRPIQIVLRIYKSPLEVIAGFDIDCCCIGYDGEKVLCLPRWKRAYEKRYNLVNVERQSTTYELRLAKYAQRGFRVAVPGFDVGKVKREGLLAVGIKKTETKPMDHLYTDPNFLNTVGVARLLILEAKMKRKMNYPLYFFEKSDYDAEFLTIPSRLRKCNPNFVNQLIHDKLTKICERVENLNQYASSSGTVKKSFQPPMVFSMNDIDSILKADESHTCLTSEVQFLLKNPGTQKKITSSFQPIEVNFFADAYLKYEELVAHRWKHNLGCYRWWFSEDGKQLKEFSKHQNKLLENGFQKKLNVMKSNAVVADYDTMTCFFTSKDKEGIKHQMFRLKDYKIPK